MQFPYYGPPFGPAPMCPRGTRPYAIRPGDTLASIAEGFGVDLASLTQVNPGVDPYNLRIGQIICIPFAVAVTCPPDTRPHRVRPGDTLGSLAYTFNTTVEAIQAANPGVDPNNLQIGQVLCIPGAPRPHRCPPGTHPYTIQAGDTLTSIAQKFNIHWHAIRAFNTMVDPYNLIVGTVLCIPAGPGTGMMPMP